MRSRFRSLFAGGRRGQLAYGGDVEFYRAQPVCGFVLDADAKKVIALHGHANFLSETEIGLRSGGILVRGETQINFTGNRIHKRAVDIVEEDCRLQRALAGNVGIGGAENVARVDTE